MNKDELKIPFSELSIVKKWMDEDEVRKIYACEMNCDKCPYPEPVDCSEAKKIENGRIINYK